MNHENEQYAIAKLPAVENRRVIADYIRACQDKELADGTIKHYRLTLRRFVDFIGNTRLADVEHTTIEAFCRNGVTVPRTMIAYCRVITSFYNWCIRRLGWRYNPTIRVKLPKAAALLPRPIPKADADEAIRLAPEPLRTGLMLAYWAGLRRAEITNVPMEDIRGGEIRVLGKGDKERMVPLHRVLLAHLEGRSGRLVPWTPAHLGRMATDHFRALGMPWTLHKGRHSFGTNFYRASQDLLLTRDALGHSSVQTTQIYAKADMKKIKGVIDSFED